MNKTQRGLKVAATTLSLLMAGVVADSGSLFAQSQTTYNDGSVVIEHGAYVAGAGAGCSSCNAPTEVVYTQPAPVYTASASSCGCSTGCKTGCTSCRKKKKSCPKCDCQFCELEVKKGEVEKTSFYAEQKEVCVPAVRLPWKKCCPPKRSKVRTVNVLKKKKYKCPQCEYKWSVHEPEDFKKPEPAENPAVAELKEEAAESSDNGDGNSIFSDPAEALGDVPRPPMEQ